MSEQKRLRKAWRVVLVVRTDQPIYFASSRAKARSAVVADLRDACDLSWRCAIREIISVRRAPDRDLQLPDRHPLAPELHPEILHCVVHAYGGTGMRAGYRDHFYTSADDWQMQAALYHGLFAIQRIDRGRDGRSDMRMYVLTHIGVAVARGEARTYPEAWQ